MTHQAREALGCESQTCRCKRHARTHTGHVMTWLGGHSTQVGRDHKCSSLRGAAQPHDRNWVETNAGVGLVGAGCELVAWIGSSMEMMQVDHNMLVAAETWTLNSPTPVAMVMDHKCLSQGQIAHPPNHWNIDNPTWQMGLDLQNEVSRM